MALVKTNGNYVVVEKIDGKIISIRYHQDAAHRERFKTGTETEFESTKGGDIMSEVNLDSEIVDSSESILNNMKILGYEYLKTLPEFEDAEDV